MAVAGGVTTAIVLERGHVNAQHQPPAKPPVVLLQLDEFPVDALLGPDGRIDAARFPNFARFAATSTWYPNTYGVHDETPYALPAVMDGRLPKRGRPAIFRGHPRSIFTLLGDRGYKVSSIEEASDICPNRLCPGAARRRKGILDNLASGRRERFETWLRTIRPRRGPAFYFKHALLPHLPWVFLPSGKRVRTTLGHLASPRGFHDPGLTRHLQQRFLLQVGYVDRLLGRLVQRLRRHDLFEDALVVITADHGISFDVGVKDRRQVSRRNLDEVGPVPFFMKAPGQSTGMIDRRYARTVDVVPTMADVLEQPLNWHVDGRSRLRAPAQARPVVSIPTRPFTGTIRIPGRVLERRRIANIRRRARLFGTGGVSALVYGSPWAMVYSQGPMRRLVGRRLRDLRIGRAAASGRFAGGERWQRVRPRAGVVPTQVAGWIPGGGGAGRRVVAVAVNGRVQAVGRTFALGGGPELFSLMAPESSLHRGRNGVELFEVAREGRSLRLLRLARSS